MKTSFLKRIFCAEAHKLSSKPVNGPALLTTPLGKWFPVLHLNIDQEHLRENFAAAVSL